MTLRRTPISSITVTFSSLISSSSSCTFIVAPSVVPDTAFSDTEMEAEAMLGGSFLSTMCTSKVPGTTLAPLSVTV